MITDRGLRVGGREAAQTAPFLLWQAGDGEETAVGVVGDVQFIGHDFAQDLNLALHIRGAFRLWRQQGQTVFDGLHREKQPLLPFIARQQEVALLCFQAKERLVIELGVSSGVALRVSRLPGLQEEVAAVA